MKTVFNYFDRNRNGIVDYEEFIRAIRVNIDIDVFNVDNYREI